MGPLTGVRVLEIEGLGPGPFAGMVLADLGAEVLQVGRRGAPPSDVGALSRGRRTVGLDLKDPAGLAALLDLVTRADALIDVFRPGVAERLGFGPEVCRLHNPRLVFARLTGYGQEGPWASRAGHDLNYLALAGALEPLGRADQPPTAPINVLADFAGGGLMCALGIIAALYERDRSGEGQVVDAAMIDGAALMVAPFYAGRTNGGWGPRGTNLLDGAAPFYETYECADGAWLAVGAIEPQFYAELLRLLELDPAGLPAQIDPAGQAQLRALFADRFRTKTRDQWAAIFDGTDACTTPVLTLSEATENKHIAARGSLIEVDGVVQHAPAPRFSRTPGGTPTPPPTTATPIEQVWTTGSA